MGVIVRVFGINGLALACAHCVYIVGPRLTLKQEGRSEGGISHN